MRTLLVFVVPSCQLDVHHVKHLRTRGKCKKHEPQVSVFYISLVFSNVRVFYSSISILIEFYLSWIFLSFRSFS